MVKYFLSVVALVSISEPGLANFSPIHDCNRDGYELLYQASTDRGTFAYWEQFPGSPSSPVLIEYMSMTAGKHWTALAERGCSQGVPRCYLSLEYLLDGKPHHEFRIEMNYVNTPGNDLLVFSHLSEKITYAYFKSHPFQKFTLQPANSFTSELEGEDFDIPNVFHKVCEE